MASTELAASGGRPASLKSVALPVEHGGWGFLIEPVVLGLLVGASWSGAAVAVFALGAFLARHPLKLALLDLRKGARHPRTALAERVAALYALGAALALALAILRSGPWLLWPLAAAAPLVLVQLVYDARNRGRELTPELAGALALGAVAASIAVAGGWDEAHAGALWLLLGARAAPAVLFVRARFRLDRRGERDLAPPLLGHALALLAAATLASLGLGPWLAALLFGLLLTRAAWGLSRWRTPLRPQALGVQELGLGLLSALLLALGYGLGV